MIRANDDQTRTRALQISNTHNHGIYFETPTEICTLSSQKPAACGVGPVLADSSFPIVQVTIPDLSRLSEDLIIYPTAEFGFVRVADSYSTGSSLMPQKKNPDSLELIRGKAGRIMGQASGFLSTLKSLPTSYDKDLQESVEPLLDCFKTVSHCVRISAGVLSTLQIDFEKIKAALTADMLATDVADYLVLKGVPFRQTHHIAGAVVRKAEEKGVSIAELELSDLKQISPQFEADIVDVFDFERSVEKRSAYGGTSRSSVLEQISAIEAYLARN
ncbi:unnamed protein product [Fusarium equiseti]|uniref:Argininosuccinate lyase n=1 Tax=Fusarium equiseti TaxID=61235 RepID=A0A8J2NGY3_FUSEQ|nr:unnamed protein product [Fusarium equiseti]